MIGTALIGWIDPTAGEDPFSIFTASPHQFLILLALLPVAVVVFWYGTKQFKRFRGTSSLRPHGRVLRESARTRTVEWKRQVERLEQRSPTAIAKAKAGAVRVRGVLCSASGNLGGPKGRECVYRNRVGARPESAVAAELVILADETGRCGIEGLEGAFVIAPADKHGQHVESVSLRLGDEIEVFAMFEPEEPIEHPSPSEIVYGTLGAKGGLDVRLLARTDDQTARSLRSGAEGDQTAGSLRSGAEESGSEPESESESGPGSDGDERATSA